MMNRIINHPIIVRYMLGGVGFGFLFPLLGTVFQILLDKLPLSLSSILLVQRSQPLLWIIDTAPLVLGFLFSLIGRMQDRLTTRKIELEQTVSDRTLLLIWSLSRIRMA
jgi:hypothetical protein